MLPGNGVVSAFVAPMSSILEAYEADYHSSTRTAAQNIEKLPDFLPGHEKAELTASTEKAIDAAEDIVKQMELEARSLQGEERQTAVAQAKDYKASITVLKEQLKLAKNSNRAEEAARAQLFQQTNPAHLAESETQRSRLLAANSKMSKASDQLRAACQIAGEHRPPARPPAHAPACAAAFAKAHTLLTHTPHARQSTRNKWAPTFWPTSTRRGKPSRAPATGEHSRARRLAPPRRPRRRPQPSALATPRPTRTLDRLSGANTNLDRSRKLLNGMARRARNNKVLCQPPPPAPIPGSLRRGRSGV